MLLESSFAAGVGLALRVEYLATKHYLEQHQKDWSANKRRLIAVRVVSLTHATLSALLCLASLLTNPNYVKEPYDYSAYNARFVFLFSMGYFAYDLFDMLFHGEARNSKEYIIHHSIVLTAFSIILYTGKLCGIAMIGLLVEVQTVLLHTRSLLHLAGYHRSNFFRVLVRFNMTFLFIFRHLPITYLLYFLLFKDDKVPLLLKTVLIGGLSFLEYHNIHLTVSMFKVDGFFGAEVADLAEDDVDPLGNVAKHKSERTSKTCSKEE